MQKRFEMRRVVRVPIEVVSPKWDTPLTLMSADLSPRGMYFECEDRLELAVPIVCSFSLSRHYQVWGRVSRINPVRRRTDAGWPGYGVEFFHVRPLTRINLRSDLRGLPPPIPTRRPDGFWLSGIGRFVPIDA